MSVTGVCSYVLGSEYTLVPPLYLYKYRSLRDNLAKERLKATLFNQELHFSIHTEFNDLFDCNIHVSSTADPAICASRLRELNPEMSDAEIHSLVEHELSPERSAEIDRGVRAGVSDALAQVGIFSLSAKPDDLLMWSYYADGHRGVCLQFRLQEGRVFGCDVTQVQYEELYPSLTAYDEMTLDWTRRHLSTKAKAWEHEAEWRIIWRQPGLNRFPAEDISGVILGARIPLQDRAEIISWIRESRARPLLYEARTKTAAFGVDIVPLGDVGGTDCPTAS